MRNPGEPDSSIAAAATIRRYGLSLRSSAKQCGLAEHKLRDLSQIYWAVSENKGQSDEAGYVTGTELIIDGGVLARA